MDDKKKKILVQIFLEDWLVEKIDKCAELTLRSRTQLIKDWILENLKKLGEVK